MDTDHRALTGLQFLTRARAGRYDKRASGFEKPSCSRIRATVARLRGLSWRPSGETGLVPRLEIHARPGRRRALDDDLSRSLDAKASGRKGPKQFPLGYR
jgi:hypothetical protein